MRLLRPLAAVVVFFALPSILGAQWLVDHDEEEEAEARASQERIKWFYDQRKSGGEIPTDAYAKAVMTTQSMKAAASGKGQMLAATPTWKLVGPSNIDPFMGYHAGRVLALAVHPTDENIAFAGSANGGIWKTVNKGRSWVPLTDNAISLAIGAVAIDPQDPTILFAGTGELAEGVGSYYGAGIMRSLDAGKTWKNVGLMNVGAFTKIIVHPKNSQRIYASGGKSGGGIFRSDDRGVTWRKLANGLPSSGASDLALAINGSEDVLYAGMPGAGVYQSLDAGETWTLKQTWLEMRRIQLDVMPNNWKEVCVLVSKNDGSVQSAERSRDGGETWEDIYAIDRDIFAVAGGGQGWYDIYIKMDPNDADHIFMGGISVWMTEDGGQSWVDVGRAYSQDGDGIHPDQHYLAFSPSNPELIYFGNDGGVWVSEDKGNTIESFEDDLAITQFYGITIDQTQPDLTYGGTQDNGTLYGSSTENWSLLATGDGSFVQVAENDPSTVFYIRPGGKTTTDGRARILGGEENGPIRNSNAGEAYLSTGLRMSDTVSWLKPLLYDSKNNRFYFGTTHLYVSSNKGGSWSRKSKQLAYGGTISYIDAFGDGKHLLLATSSGKVQYTTDEGVSFTDRSAGLPGRYVTSAKFSPGSKATIYATLSGFGGGHVYRSVDAGATWTNISSNLPDVPVNEMVIDPDNPTSLYLATDVGVFFSPNDGAEWMPYGTGLPNVAVFDMDIHRTSRVLRAGSHGRSIWEIPLSNETAAITSPTVGKTWIFGQPGTVSWRGLPAGEATVEISADGGDTFKELGKSSSSRLELNKVNELPTLNAVVRAYVGNDTVRSGLFQIQQLKAGMISHVVSQQPLYMYDIAFDEEQNVLYATHFDATVASATKLYKIHPDNGEILGTVDLGPGRNSLTGITFDKETKHLWVHSARTDNTSRVYEVTREGNVIRSFNSPAVYGTGIMVQGDTLLLVDRNPDNDGNRIFKLDKNDPAILYYDMYVTRHSPFGGRCLTWDPNKNQLLHTWTDFQGNDLTSQLYDSYLTWLNPTSGEEISYTYVQEATNQGTNVRGLELDTRNGGNSLWMTLLGSGGSSSSLIKVNLKDSPLSGVGPTGSSSPIGALEQNYPNPFNPSTTIPFTLSRAGHVEITITDELGRDLMTTERRFLGQGDHYEILDASRLTSGTYTYTLRVDGIRIDSKRMTLVK
jgi:photosystem II stability/assembly factor-like uncharacterized protein